MLMARGQDLQLLTLYRYGGRGVVYCSELWCFVAQMPGQRQLGLQPQRRCMQLVYSPHLAQSYCYYIVSQQGIQVKRQAGLLVFLLWQHQSYTPILLLGEEAVIVRP